MTAIDHSHCPYECEHPQPFERPAGWVTPAGDTLTKDTWYCGRCYFMCDGLLTEMVPCTPENCE